MENKDYYKAYEKRYKQVYDQNMLWTSQQPTPDVINFIKDNNVTKNCKILDLGCGEGRDANFLLNEGYNVFALDYSQNAINKCNELSNNKYKDKFFQFDIMEDELNEKFDYIYSVAVLHMFVIKEHRDKFLTFIKNHLTKDGKCLLCMLGDGVKESETNINEAFNNAKRIIMNNNKEVMVASTSCKIVNFDSLNNELNNNNLVIEKSWLSKDVPEFTTCMCVIIKRN